MDHPAPLTDLIRRAQDGDQVALRQVFDTTYEDLRRMARGRISQGARGTLLDTTSLVHESFLRFANAGEELLSGVYALELLIESYPLRGLKGPVGTQQDQLDEAQIDAYGNGGGQSLDVTNPNEGTADVPAGTYSADVVLEGTEDVAIGPADLDLAEGTSTIVYAWGSAEDGNLDLAVQTIDGLHSAPAGVPGGEAGLAPESNGVPAWALGLGLTSVLALAFAGRQLMPARARR